MAVTYMTAEGLQKLKDELQFLESTERPRVIAAIAEARDKGDLSENAEYDAAKEEQGHLESRIAQLKGKIMDARIIDQSTVKTDEVQILTKVRVRVKKSGAEKVYQLVTEGEANIAAFRECRAAGESCSRSPGRARCRFRSPSPRRRPSPSAYL